jgi:large subunit ribosomal protein L35
MPKMKTHSGAKKRMRLTARKKVKRKQANTSHLMRNKSKKSKRKHVSSTTVHSVEEKRMQSLLGVH